MNTSMLQNIPPSTSRCCATSNTSLTMLRLSGPATEALKSSTEQFCTSKNQNNRMKESKETSDEESSSFRFHEAFSSICKVENKGLNASFPKISWEFDN